MKKISVITVSSVLILIALGAILLQPLLSFGQVPSYHGVKIENWKKPIYDRSKKTVFIIADNTLTEMFDMLAPFYIFNATEQFNVYIIAKSEIPIPLKRDLYVLPQLTFGQADQMHLKADVIVLPAMSIQDENQDPVVINFIKSHYEETTRVLAICDGASTAAATGFYDGKSITCHATDFDDVKKHFDKPNWIQNVSVVQSGNLFSTAGVANAVEGSLLIVEKILGRDARVKVGGLINYPHSEIQIKHNSIALSFGNKMSIGRKMVFYKKRNLGLLLHDGLNELKFASIVDTYSRTIPKEIKTFSLRNSIVKTQYGLTFIHTGGNAINPKMDEVHVVMPELLTKLDEAYFKGFEIVKQNANDYAIDQCLKHIGENYGEYFKGIVKLTLDYN